MPRGFRYSRWDGTQRGFDLEADEILSELSDDLLYHGDLTAALRRLLQSGLQGPDGERVPGLQELLERLRRRRQKELQRHNLAGLYDRISQELDDIVATERKAVEKLARRDDQLAAERRDRLDLLPPDLPGRIGELSSYPFLSERAGARFEQLMEQLRDRLQANRFDDMARRMSQFDAAQRQRLVEMLAALNEMLEARARGEEPDFDRFMRDFGDFFPGRPQDLDELLEQMAMQMAASRAVLDAMTPEQRAELERLAAELMSDADLAWQVDQLGRRLQALFPLMGLDPGEMSAAADALGFAEVTGLMERLGQLDQLEHLLGSALSPGALAEADLDVAAELLGDDAARSLERLAELTRVLEQAGLIEQREGRYELTPRGIRRLGQKALDDIFTKLTRDRLGRHELAREGPGHERSYDSKLYEYGDPFNLSIQRTVRNALQRTGQGVPVGLRPDDFEVERTETLTRSSTVLLLDLSLSMPMRDNFLAAKKVAMALHSMISTQFPRDYLGVVGFSEVARELRPEQLPEVSWDFVFGTNMQHALVLARRMLAGKPGTRQVVMITDGEPTAHVVPGGEVHFEYPPTQETIDATLGEVARCTREGICINTFMLDASRSLRAFVERMSRMNRGRAFFTTPETLGDYVLVDFIEQKRTRRRAGA